MKTVLITGGTVRLGKAIAERLRKEGWHVLTSSHRADAGADIVADLSDPMGAARLYAAALRMLDGIPPDALVNNAALYAGDEAAIRAVNFEAPRKLTVMMAGREDGVGAVVNILDRKVLNICSPQDAPYLKSKRGLLDETIKSAQMFAATLRINGVAPGPVLAPADIHEKAGELLLDHRPSADDVAEAVSYLLRAEAVTATVIPVDSGQHLIEEV